MRIAQLSDLHFCPRNLEESSRCFGFGVEEAINRGAELAVISGDSTDHALDVHSPAFEALVRYVRRLADHMPVLMLQGTWSHEPPGTLNVFRLLGAACAIHVVDRIEQVALLNDGSWLPSNGWHFETLPTGCKALFSGVPTLNKATVAGAVGGAAAGQEHGELLATLLRGFAPINTEARAAGIPTIGVSHGTVNGCQTEHGVPMAGLDHEFTSGSLFGAKTSAFMLGHIHKHQQWQSDDGQLIAYPGSIGRFHYGELGEKGFLLWQVEAGCAACELVVTPAKRTIELSFDGPPDVKALQDIAAGSQGAFVRVRWEVSEEDRHQVDRDAIVRALAGAAEVKLEGRVLPMNRTRAAGIGAAQTAAQKLARWADVTGAAAAPLLERLEALQSADPEQIVAGVLGLEALPPAAAAREPDRPQGVEADELSLKLFE